MSQGKGYVVNEQLVGVDSNVHFLNQAEDETNDRNNKSKELSISYCDTLKRFKSKNIVSENSDNQLINLQFKPIKGVNRSLEFDI